jgi:hypothetical protein
MVSPNRLTSSPADRGDNKRTKDNKISFIEIEESFMVTGLSLIVKIN